MHSYSLGNPATHDTTPGAAFAQRRRSRPIRDRRDSIGLCGRSRRFRVSGWKAALARLSALQEEKSRDRRGTRRYNCKSSRCSKCSCPE